MITTITKKTAKKAVKRGYLKAGEERAFFNHQARYNPRTGEGEAAWFNVNKVDFRSTEPVSNKDAQAINEAIRFVVASVNHLTVTGGIL